MESMSSEESARLAEQHAYIRSALGFAIHPTIQTALKSPAREIHVADVSLSLQFPKETGNEHAQLPFQDYQLEHLVPHDIVSSTGLEPSLAGRFDIVAVRLLHANLTPEQWPTTIANLHALLRPGGWLQWVDWDPLTARIAGVKAGAPDTAIRDLFHRFVDTMKANKVGTTYKIPNSLTVIGMEDEDSDMFTVNPEVQFTRNIAIGALSILQQSGSVDSNELNRLKEQVDEEIRLGSPLLWYDLWCHIAKKPAAGRLSPTREAKSALGI